MSKAAQRISNQAGYVLHSWRWSESSLILEAFTRSFGRIALLAKGARRPSSNFRPVLLPMQPLLLTWGGSAEIRTLKGVEWGGGHIMPAGVSALYAAGCQSSRGGCRAGDFEEVSSVYFLHYFMVFVITL